MEGINIDDPERWLIECFPDAYSTLGQIVAQDGVEWNHKISIDLVRAIAPERQK
jgi:hypothetical protein